MEVIVIESAAFDELEKRMMKRFEKALQNSQEQALRNINPDLSWLNTEDALKFLGFKSRNHLYNLRRQGILRSKMINGQIRYNYLSLIDYLNTGIDIS